ncbi:MAG TPA: DUF3103 family protein [Kofleriaceae bacterium]|nr:DUF3103 family protein [Kofleriaceae bacterium]
MTMTTNEGGVRVKAELATRFPRTLFASLFLGSLGALAIAGCDMAADDIDESEPTSQPVASKEPAINSALDSTARLFARAVSDPALRQQIHDMAGQRFDGDVDVLYKTLAASTAVRGGLASAYQLEPAAAGVAAKDPAEAALAVDDLVAEIPRLQVAVPVHFDQWDAKGQTPLVGYMPAGVDDTTLETITAFDADGVAHTLDGQVPPDEPVIILSQNERTDDDGNVRAEFLAQPAGGVTTQGLYEVRVLDVTMFDTNENWALGDPEVRLIAKGTGLFWHGSFIEVNQNNHKYVFNRSLGNSSSAVIFYWYEDDGGALDFTVSYKGISLGVKIDNDDDFMGEIQLANSTFEGGSNWPSDMGDIAMTTD